MLCVLESEFLQQEGNSLEELTTSPVILTESTRVDEEAHKDMDPETAGA